MTLTDEDCPPLPPTRMRHRGDKINAQGRMSALCFPKPRAIDMKRATWVMSDDATTCPKCRALIEARLKRLGLPKTCPTCEGDGYTYTEPAAHVSLILWWLHPRKGCSRGIEVTRLEREDLPAVQALLKEAAQRNAERFNGVGLIA